jgi:excisionase family DNA binding protein
MSRKGTLNRGEERASANLWSIEDVAEYLSVPVGTVYSRRKRRQGPKAYRVGRHLRFRSTDVEAWLEEQSA